MHGIITCSKYILVHFFNIRKDHWRALAQYFDYLVAIFIILQK